MISYKTGFVRINERVLVTYTSEFMKITLFLTL